MAITRSITSIIHITVIIFTTIIIYTILLAVSTISMIHITVIIFTRNIGIIRNTMLFIFTFGK